MTDQQQNQNEDQIDGKAAIEKVFAATIGTLAIDKAVLEKKAETQANVIQQMAENEATLIKRIQELKAEVIELKRSVKYELSPEAKALAADGEAIIDNEGKENTAPVEEVLG